MGKRRGNTKRYAPGRDRKEAAQHYFAGLQLPQEERMLDELTIKAAIQQDVYRGALREFETAARLAGVSPRELEELVEKIRRDALEKDKDS